MSETIKAVLGVVVVLGLAAGAGATPNIVVGTRYLQPNQAGQTIGIYVTGGDAVQGLNFYVCIGGNTAGPIIGGADILNGTIFDPNNTGPGGADFTYPHHAGRYTTTTAGTVPASGLLATLTLDTTGLYDGTYDLSLTIPASVYGYVLETDFAGIDADITDGYIIVPEPTSMMIILAGSGLLIRRRRNRIRR